MSAEQQERQSVSSFYSYLRATVPVVTNCLPCNDLSLFDTSKRSAKCRVMKHSWPRGYKPFFMLTSAEHEICPANKSQITNMCKFFLAKHS